MNITVTTGKAEKIQARIVDNLGKVLKQQPWELLPGNNSLKIDISNFANGVYYLQLHGETVNEYKKFIKQ